MNLKDKVILITGGTGSFGNALVDFLINLKKSPKKIIVFSRDELKQFEMQKKYEKHYNFSLLRFFLGDIRDKDRLKTAFRNVDIIVHAAALKQVPAAEYNPIEFVKTNIIGAQNIIEESISSNVKKIVSLSTDKASSPINLYGATKLCSDKLFLSAYNLSGNKKIKFSVVRYGNVFGSRGSVYPHFKKLILKKENIYITHKDMTRFNISLMESVKMVLWAIENSVGGEIVVPKIPSYRVVDLANLMTTKDKIKYSSIRPGEKIHEELISKEEARHTYDLGKYYVVSNENSLIKYSKYKKVKKDFSFNSLENEFLTAKQLLANIETLNF